LAADGKASLKGGGVRADLSPWLACDFAVPETPHKYAFPMAGPPRNDRPQLTPFAFPHGPSAISPLSETSQIRFPHGQPAI